MGLDPPHRALEKLSAGEVRFERLRRRVGLWLAPAVFVVMLLAPFPGLPPAAHRLAAVMVAVVILWMSEALPLPVTALAGAAACVLLEVAPAKDVFAPFADPLMFLFIGAFILARALFVHNLHRRLAFGVLSLRWVGARPGRILFAFGAVTAFSSSWISNTATTAMMFAIGMSILAFLFEFTDGVGGVTSRRYATALMLMTSFAASIGGLATPIGTPPNLIGLGFIRQLAGVDFPFFRWVVIGAPMVLLLYLFLFAYLNYLSGAGVKEIPGGSEMLHREKQKLGSWTRGQKSTLAAFLVTVVLWVVPGFVGLLAGADSAAYRALHERLPEAVAALVGALLLFLLPGDGDRRAITWEEAVKIDWGVVLLYGGGFALGVLSFQTGLAEAVGRGITGLLPLHDSLGLLIASAIAAVLLSETTSNTASANMIVPVVIAIARASGLDPLEPALGATFAASLGFMLPVSTPCNAIVYGSGYIPLGRMMRYGLLLDVVGIVVVVTVVHLLVPFLR
ncbi:MAG TPA: DASS family sodium-coupled anion symporter [Terriglobales bacterium]|nr:DASS family sodium-coupled anion symporter [Terriglobales bacterium]